MPIVVEHGSAISMLTLASAAGLAQGRARKDEQQRGIDAQTNAQVRGMAIQAAMERERNRGPSFAQRIKSNQSRGGGGGGSPSVETYGAGGREGSPEARAFQSRQAALEEKSAQVDSEASRRAAFRKAKRSGASNLADFIAEEEFARTGGVSGKNAERLFGTEAPQGGVKAPPKYVESLPASEKSAAYPRAR